MATPVVGAGIGADPESSAKLTEALDAQLRALENRGGTNWAKIAAAMANPGRTGNWSEGFANAMGVIGQQREEEEKQALPIAQMRAQLVGQKYQMQKEQASDKALANALGGGNAADIMQSITSPEGAFGNPQLYRALVRAQMEAKPGTEAAAKIDRLLKTQQEQLKLGIDMGTLNIAQVASRFQYGPQAGNTPQGVAPPAGAPRAVDPNTISGPARLQPIPADGGTMGTPPVRAPGEEADFHGTERQPVASAASTEAPKTTGGWTKISPTEYRMEGTNRVERFAQNATPDAIQKRLLESAKAEHEKTLALEKAQAESDIQLQKEEKIKRAAPHQAQYATLSGYNYNTVKDSEAKYNELINLVRKNPDVVGTLVHQGPLYALLHTVQEGVRTPSGSLSLDVIGAINKLYQNEEQQSAARNIAQLISDLNQQVMKKGKDIFGPQISEYDAKQMAEPGFKSTDPAEFLIYLATKNDLTNRYMGKMADAQHDYFDKNPNASTGSFFNPKNSKSPYKSIVDEYADLNKQLIDASPYNRRGK